MTAPTGNPRGRPKGSKQVSPKSDTAAMKVFRDRLINSPKSAKVIESIFAAALNDEHKNQAAAWKMVMDRIAPLSGFDKAAGSSPRTAIQVNISGVPGLKTEEGDIIEGEVIGDGT